MFNFLKQKYQTLNTLPNEEIDQVYKRLNAIREINHKIVGVTDSKEVLELASGKLISLLGVSYAVIWIYDNESRLLKLAHLNVPPIVASAIERFIGKSIKEVNYNIDDEVFKQNFTVKTFLEGKLSKTDDLLDAGYPLISRSSSTILQNLLRIKFVLHIPLISKGEKLGVLGLIWNTDEFTQSDEDLVLTFGDQISTALYNSTLFEQINNQVISLTKKNEELSSLYNLTAKVSSSLEPTQVAQDAVDSLPQNKLMVGAIISMYNKSREYISPLAASHTQLSYGIEKLIGDLTQYGLHLSDPMATENLVMRSFVTGKIVYDKELTNFLVPAINKRFVKPIADLLQIKGVAVFPLIVRNQVIGTLSFFIQEKEIEQLDVNDKQLLQTYTNQIAIALENARLYEESEVIRSELQSTIKQLENSRKHERDMIDIMGHELRTPMSILRNSLLIMDTQMKIKPPDLMDKIHKYIEIGVEAARREVSLIETLLSATKTDGKGFQLILEEININDLINNAMVAFKRQSELKGINLIYERSETKVLIYSDRTRVQEIVDNFVNNAVKYTITGSVTIKVFEKDGLGYFTVKDTGVGIGEDDLKRLGTKFFRARQYLDDEPQKNANAEKLEIIRPGGTGLGLYVTFNLIKLLGATLVLESKVREGSTFGAGFIKYTGQSPAQMEKKIEQFDQGM